ncbi:unnamed protein product [Effrenium voratum]|nr:unnamed protein product [Effrenium voratum]
MDPRDDRRYFFVEAHHGWVPECSRKDPSKVILEEHLTPAQKRARAARAEAEAKAAEDAKAAEEAKAAEAKAAEEAEAQGTEAEGVKAEAPAAEAEADAEKAEAQEAEEMAEPEPQEAEQEEAQEAEAEAPAEVKASPKKASSPKKAAKARARANASPKASASSTPAPISKEKLQEKLSKESAGDLPRPGARGGGREVGGGAGAAPRRLRGVDATHAAVHPEDQGLAAQPLAANGGLQAAGGGAPCAAPRGLGALTQDVALFQAAGLVQAPARRLLGKTQAAVDPAKAPRLQAKARAKARAQAKVRAKAKALKPPPLEELVSSGKIPEEQAERYEALCDSGLKESSGRWRSSCGWTRRADRTSWPSASCGTWPAWSRWRKQSPRRSPRPRPRRSGSYGARAWGRVPVWAEGESAVALERPKRPVLGRRAQAR